MWISTKLDARCVFLISDLPTPKSTEPVYMFPTTPTAAIVKTEGKQSNQTKSILIPVCIGALGKQTIYGNYNYDGVLHYPWEKNSCFAYIVKWNRRRIESLKYDKTDYSNWMCNVPTRQGSSIVRRIRTWRWEDDLFWARMKVFRTSFYVPASVERNSYVRFGRDVDQRPLYVRDEWGRPENFNMGPK